MRWGESLISFEKVRDTAFKNQISSYIGSNIVEEVLPHIEWLLMDVILRGSIYGSPIHILRKLFRKHCRSRMIKILDHRYDNAYALCSSCGFMKRIWT